MFVEINNRIHPAPNLLKADNPGQQVGMNIAMVAITAVAVIALLQRNAARSRQLAASASGQLALDPERSLLLAIRAFKTKRTEDAEVALRQALLDSSVRARLEHKNAAFDATFSPDGRGVVSAGSDGTVRVWNPKTGRQVHVLIAHTAPVLSVAFSPGGRAALSASGDNTVRLWDVKTGEEVRPPVPRNVVDGATRVDEIERASGNVAGGVTAHPADPDPMRACEPLRLLQAGRRHVQAGHVAAALREEHAVAALAAAEIEHTGARGQQCAHLACQQGGLRAPNVGLGGAGILPGPGAPNHGLIQPT